MIAIVCLGCRAIRHALPDRHGRLSPPPCKCGDVSWTTLEAADRDRAGVAICVRNRHRNGRMVA